MICFNNKDKNTLRKAMDEKRGACAPPFSGINDLLPENYYPLGHYSLRSGYDHSVETVGNR